MSILPKPRFIIMIVLFMLLSPYALSEWKVDNGLSTVSFITIKKKDAAEVHHFKEVSGQLSDSGEFKFTVDLNSVDTSIEVRDQRMREVLFNTVDFPDVTLTAQLDGKVISSLQAGDAQAIVTEASINLHGQSQTVKIEALVVRSGDKLIVASSKPVVVNAAEFDLAKGVEKLREIAKLPSISHAVPVSFVLVLTP